MIRVRKQKFDYACRLCVMDEYVKPPHDATDRVKQLLKHIATFQPLVKAMMGFRRIQILSATVIAAEIGDLRRFKATRQFMAFLGLVPSESSSGNSVKRGSLTRTGNGHVRRILFEVLSASSGTECGASQTSGGHFKGDAKHLVGGSTATVQPPDSFRQHWQASQQGDRSAGREQLAGFIGSGGQVSPLLA